MGARRKVGVQQLQVRELLILGQRRVGRSDGVGGAIVLTVTLDGGDISAGNDDMIISVPIVNNIVDQQKVATVGNNTVSSSDLLTNRPGSDTISTGNRVDLFSLIDESTSNFSNLF